MRFNRLDLNLLVALDALLTEQNITRAAERLNLSQSATSGILGRLRDYFDDDLLVQVGRKMEPTLLAQRLAGPIRELILQIQSTLAITSSFDPQTAQRAFKICASDYVSSVLLTQVVREREQRAPNTTLEIMPQYDDIQVRLRRGEFDFVVIPQQLTVDDQPSTVLFEESYTCVVWEGNDKVGDTLSLEQYFQLGHIAPRFGASRQPTFEEWFFKQHGMKRRVEVIASSFSTMAPLLVGTSLVATMHTHLAKRSAEYLPIRLLPVPLEIPKLTECLQWPRHLENDPGHIWMRQLLLEMASRLV